MNKKLFALLLSGMMCYFSASTMEFFPDRQIVQQQQLVIRINDNEIYYYKEAGFRIINNILTYKSEGWYTNEEIILTTQKLREYLLANIQANIVEMFGNLVLRQMGPVFIQGGNAIKIDQEFVLAAFIGDEECSQMQLINTVTPIIQQEQQINKEISMIKHGGHFYITVNLPDNNFIISKVRVVNGLIIVKRGGKFVPDEEDSL